MGNPLAGGRKAEPVRVVVKLRVGATALAGVGGQKKQASGEGPGAYLPHVGCGVESSAGCWPPQDGIAGENAFSFKDSRCRDGVQCVVGIATWR